MNVLELFAGAGGGILGAQLLGHRCVCAVELDPYCREVLMARQEDKTLPPFPIWDDVRTFDGKPWRGIVDVVSGGFPCQPFSVAGKRKLEQDERNMWPEMRRVIRQVMPTYALMENVPGLLSCDYFGEIVRDLAESGYSVRWDCISAFSVGAHFQGERVWILASSAAANSLRRKGKRENTTRAFSRDELARLVEHEISICVPAGKGKRVSDGVSNRVDRLKAIGNAQIPAMAAFAWETLTEEINA